MQRYTPLFNALLAAVPYLTREDLPKVPPAEDEDLVCRWLFKHLGWYHESGNGIMLIINLWSIWSGKSHI